MAEDFLPRGGAARLTDRHYGRQLELATSYFGALDSQAVRGVLLEAGLPLAEAAAINKLIWCADVGNRHCVRVREGGEVLATVDVDRGAFACALSRGEDPRLFVVGQNWGGPESSEPSGRVVAFPAPAPGAGKP